MAIPDDRSTIVRPLLAAGVLAALAVVVVTTLALVHQATESQIERNARAWFLGQLHTLVPPDSYDNDLLTDRIFVTAPAALGTNRPMPVYRARHDSQPVAAILTTIAPDGYGGPIELMVAVHTDGTLIGVSVLRHRETPGLGDVFEPQRSNWLESFAGRSLGDPPRDTWTVRKDGGAFDQFTGATITPRAIIGAVRRALEFFELERSMIFAAEAPQ